MQYSVPDTKHDFCIIYETYQYVLACLGLWHIFLIYNICTYPQSLSYYLWSFLVLQTRVRMLKCKIVYCVHIYEHYHPVNIFFSDVLEVFSSPLILYALNFFIFIHSCSCFIVAFLFLRLYFFVDMSNCLVDVTNFFVYA